MQDLNKLSFSIAGDASQATRTLTSLITKLDKLDVAFGKVAVSGTSFANVLGQISGIGTTISTSMQGINSANKKFTTTIANSTKAVRTNTTANQKGITGLTKLNNLISIGSKNNAKYTSSLNKTIAKISQLTFVVYSLRKAFMLVSTGAQNAIAYVENLNLFMVALGENTTRATGFINEMADSLYLDEAQLTRVQGLFYQISESLGLSSEKAYTLSENFTKLAYDLASFYNITIEDAVTKLQAGLVGETEPLRRIGIIITENNLAETARNLGITKSIRNMTEQEKIQLRYITALQQTQNAQGDLARTMEQPENLLRIAKEQITKLGRELGNVFIPILKKVIPEVIGFTMALTEMAKSLASSLGYEAPEISDDLGGYNKVVEATEDVEDNTSETASNLKSALTTVRQLSTATTGIDELNIVSQNTSMDLTNLFDTGDVTEATDSLNLALDDYNNGMIETNGVFDDVVDKWKAKFAEIKETFNGAFDDTKEQISDIIDLITNKDADTTMVNFKNILNIIDNILAGILKGFKETFEVVRDLYNDYLKPILESVAPKWFDDLQGQGMIDVVAKITKMAIALKAMKVGANVVKFLAHLVTLAPYTLSLGYVIGLATTLYNIVKDTMELIDDNGTFKEFIEMSVEKLGLNDLVDDVEERIIKPLQEFIDAIKEVINIFFPKTNSENDYSGSTGGGGAWGDSSTESGFFSRIWSDYTSKNTTVDVNADPKKILEVFNGIGNGLAYLFTGGLAGTPFSGFYANGGTPQKGSLFIAGEAGAELVGDLGQGGTSVVNKKQAKQLGIPMFANGTNVPASLSPHTDMILKSLQEQYLASKALREKVESIEIPKWTEKEQKASVKKGGGGYAGSIVPKWSDTERTNVETYDPNAELNEAGDDVSWIDKIKDAFGSLYSKMKPVLKSFATAGKVVVNFYEAFQSSDTQAIMSEGLDGGESTVDQQNVMNTLVGSMLGDGTAGMIFSLMNDINDGILESFLESLPTFIKAGMDMIVSLIEGVKDALPTLLGMIPDMITEIVGYLTDEDALNTIINGLLDMVVQLALALPDIMVALVDAIPTVITAIIEAIVSNLDQFAKVGVIIAVALIDALINTVIAGINALIKLINKIPFVDIGYITYSSDMASSVSSAMGYADGGYPMQGEMFIAREAGAELVGNIGGKTGVMNNDQIIESVSSGVYEAVSKAMSENSNNETVINLDGKRVSERLDVADRTRGNTYGMGGF